MSAKQLFIFADGGARGNPGPAAIGFIIKDSRGKVLTKVGKYIGEATNNVAEYQAVIEALKWIREYRNEGEKWEASREVGVRSGENKKTKHSPTHLASRPASHVSSPPQITFFLDSKLIVSQLNGLFKVKQANLRSLIIKIRQLEQEVGGNVSYNFIPREKNKEADTLVNQSLG